MNGKTVINHIGACINKIKSLSSIKTGGDLIAWPVQKGGQHPEVGVSVLEVLQVGNLQ